MKNTPYILTIIGKWLFIPLFCLSGVVASGASNGNGPTNDVQHLRKLYLASVQSSDTAQLFHETMKKYKATRPLEQGFAGAAETLMARHAWNPYNKLEYLKTGMKKINTAIDRAPEDVELRFLRFSVEHSLPGFLGYGDHLEADRKAIESYFLKWEQRNKPPQVERVILNFMIDSGACSKTVEDKLTNRLN